MPLLRTIASSLLSRRAARRVSRVIPNPILRYAVVTAATALAPMVVDRAVAAWRAHKGRSSSAAAPVRALPAST